MIIIDYFRITFFSDLMYYKNFSIFLICSTRNNTIQENLNKKQHDKILYSVSDMIFKMCINKKDMILDVYLFMIDTFSGQYLTYTINSDNVLDRTIELNTASYTVKTALV